MCIYHLYMYMDVHAFRYVYTFICVMYLHALTVLYIVFCMCMLVPSFLLFVLLSTEIPLPCTHAIPMFIDSTILCMYACINMYVFTYMIVCVCDVYNDCVLC